MGMEHWKSELKTYFDNVKIIEKCKAETIENFDQFCEFIAEPAFEALIEELVHFSVKGKSLKSKGKYIHLQLNFPGLKIDNFHYIIVLPKNSVELKLRLKIKGRKNPLSAPEETEGPFMEGLKAPEILKLTKEALLEDVIRHYRDFSYRAFTSSD